MTTYKTYDEIPNGVFADKILELAAKDIQHTLSLSGVWEVISEEFNNAALAELCPHPINE